jgi:ubiquinone/menaquinone biosynthesis C-methylase UbiE
MHEGFRALTVAPFRLLPSSLRRRLVQALTFAAADAAPDRALRELLAMDTVLSGQIDLAAMAYGNGVHVKHRLMRYHDFFVSHVAAGERVLDIGCGYGAVGHAVATRSAATVVGLDSDPANIEKARRLFPHERLTLVVGTAPASVPPGPFDTIILSNVLEHIEHRPEFLHAIQAAVSPAQWLIRVPMFTRDWRPSLRHELGLYAYSDPTHFTEYTDASFRDEMAAANFEIRHLQVNWGEIWAVVGRPRSDAAR